MSRFPAMGTAHFCFMEHWILAVSTAQAVQTIGFVQVLLAGFRLKIDVPEVGDCKPANIFNIVDLPAPFLLTKALRSFLFTTNEMSSKSVKPPNSTVSPSTEIILSL